MAATESRENWGKLGVKEQSLRLTEEQIEADKLEFHRVSREYQDGDRGAMMPLSAGAREFCPIHLPLFLIQTPKDPFPKN